MAAAAPQQPSGFTQLFPASARVIAAGEAELRRQLAGKSDADVRYALMRYATFIRNRFAQLHSWVLHADGERPLVGQIEEQTQAHVVDAIAAAHSEAVRSVPPPPPQPRYTMDVDAVCAMVSKCRDADHARLIICSEGLAEIQGKSVAASDLGGIQLVLDGKCCGPEDPPCYIASSFASVTHKKSNLVFGLTETLLKKHDKLMQAFVARFPRFPTQRIDNARAYIRSDKCTVCLDAPPVAANANPECPHICACAECDAAAVEEAAKMELTGGRRKRQCWICRREWIRSL